MKFSLPDKIQKVLYGMIAVGILSLIVGFVLDKDRAWLGLLSMAYFILSISLLGVFFAAVQFIAGARWSVVLRRIPETFLAPLPIAAVMMLLVVIGVVFHWNHLYEWADKAVVAKDEILHKKSGYLNVPFFIIRLAIYFTAWYFVGNLLKKTSLEQDTTKDQATKSRLTKYGAIYVLMFAYTFMLAGIDIVMSLQPHWFTTMFPVYCFANGFYGAVAAMIIILVTIQKHGGLKDVNAEHLHDLGKFQLMTTIFWAYIAYSMHMLTWYANMPEETYLLEVRLKGVWKYFTYGMWIFHFAVPFFILLSRDLKRSGSRIVKVCWLILFMAWVDIVWMVYGSALGHAGGEAKANSFPLGPLEIGFFFGSVGLFGLAFFKAFAKHAEAPTGDIHYEESRHFHQTF